MMLIGSRRVFTTEIRIEQVVTQLTDKQRREIYLSLIIIGPAIAVLVEPTATTLLKCKTLGVINAAQYVVEKNCLVAEYRVPYRIRNPGSACAPLIDGLGHATPFATYLEASLRRAA